MNLIIQKLELKYLNELVTLFELYRGFYGMMSDVGSSTEFLKQRLINKDSEIIIALERERLVGFAQLYPLFSSTQLKRLWLLNDLFVSDKFRGLGVSKQLLNHCKELARETNSNGIILETQKSNHLANKLYAASDFEMDTDHNYYFWNNK